MLIGVAEEVETIQNYGMRLICSKPAKPPSIEMDSTGEWGFRYFGVPGIQMCHKKSTYIEASE